ncbi:hypothetical protein Asp14428_15150 [Actinoplanes sp. NBRC 14428]|nr:hypothetical protein Asp14428_15150 [Actinoplanes sp. NBRC 14428]
MRRVDFLVAPGDGTAAVYRRYRAGEPVLWEPSVQMYCVFRFADIRTCLTSPDFTVEYPFRVSRTVFGRTLLDVDGPWHVRGRRLLTGLLRGRIENLPFADIVDAEVDRAVDALADAHHVDFVERVARPLPTAVTAAFLGIAPEHRARIFSHLDYLLDHLDGSSREFATAIELRREIEAVVRRMLHDGGAEPGTVIGRLTPAVRSGEVGVPDAIGLVLLVLAAGVETSSGMLANTMAAFGRFPGWAAPAAADPEVMRRFVREVLRFDPPQTETVRFARVDTRLAGVPIAAGSALKLVLSSGNRDETVFADGDRFDPARTERASLSFGHGPHSCLGLPLATGLATTFFTAFFRRFPRARSDDPVPPAEGSTFRRPATLPTTLEPPGGRGRAAEETRS